MWRGLTAAVCFVSCCCQNTFEIAMTIDVFYLPIASIHNPSLTSVMSGTRQLTSQVQKLQISRPKSAIDLDKWARRHFN